MIVYHCYVILEILLGRQSVTDFLNERKYMTLKIIGEDSIYLENGDLTGVIESPFIYLNPLKTYR